MFDNLLNLPKSDRKDASQDMQIEEEWEPGGGLVLGYAGDNGDVDLGVAGVPERVEPTRPGGHYTCMINQVKI